MQKPEKLSSAFLTIQHSPFEYARYSNRDIDRIYAGCFEGSGINPSIIEGYSQEITPVFLDFSRFVRDLWDPMELSAEPSPEAMQERVFSLYGNWHNAFSEYIKLFLGLEDVLKLESSTDTGLVTESRRVTFAGRKNNYQVVQQLLSLPLQSSS